MNNKLIILSILFSSIVFEIGFAQQKNANVSDKSVQKLNDKGCLNLMQYYSGYWKTDSIGNSGFREVFIQYLNCRCSIIGVRWDRVENFFGKPNRVSVRENQQLYIYKLTNYIQQDNLLNSALYITDDKKSIITSFDKFNPS
ncbi:hypothetical protein [Pinibacter aurantiacus]|uniref:Uncharacterized protein n=1 Tax=Pinibacter aurantiacus TaxID=2851599 RepID=A0A9E2SBI9_9BACT|nr:hypothetical protein [Pinibacter aurantiacus]MBV4359097.1 hypothetical protein [Pinibacter aurantiacus]